MAIVHRFFPLALLARMRIQCRLNLILYPPYIPHTSSFHVDVEGSRRGSTVRLIAIRRGSRKGKGGGGLIVISAVVFVVVVVTTRVSTSTAGCDKFHR